MRARRSSCSPPNRNFFPVRLVKGVDRDAAFADINGRISLYAVGLQQPTDLVNFGHSDALPLVGAGLFALIAAAMLTHLLLSNIRRRRRDLALLRTLGFTRPQTSVTVAAQATTLAIVAMVFGIPLGAAAGRWAWTATADGLGVVAEPVVPLLPLAGVVPLTIVVANLVAAAPARLASRTGAAVVLRSE